MKKTLILILLLGIGFTARAQFFTLGVKAGASSSGVDIENPENNVSQFRKMENITGYHAGAFMRFKVGNILFQPEGTLTHTGGTVEVTESQNSTNYEISKYRFNRLDVPLLLGYSFFKVARVHAGPVASVLITGKLNSERIDEYLQESDWGWQAGLGVDIGNITADIRYEYVNRNYTNIPENNGYDINNDQIVLSVGLKLVGK
jgi:opacity protein-like surface antigen